MAHNVRRYNDILKGLSILIMTKFRCKRSEIYPNAVVKLYFRRQNMS